MANRAVARVRHASSSADNDVHVMAKSMEEAFEKKVPELLAAYDPAADGGGRPKVCHPRHMRHT